MAGWKKGWHIKHISMKNKGRISLGICAGLTLLVLSQCSPYTGKNLLNFFFDGVPESDTLLAGTMDPEDAAPDSLALSEGMPVLSGPSHTVHYPYEEGECASCHNENSLGTLVEAQPDLCYLCHEDLSASYGYLHGPVAGGYCTSCHDPHRSKSGKLLRLTGEALCFYCHEKESVVKNEMHQDLEGMFCMDCHNPHGGEDKYIFQ